MRRWAPVLAVLLCLGMAPTVAQATGSDCYAHQNAPECLNATAQGDAFDVSAGQAQGTGSGGGAGAQPVAGSSTYVTYQYAPACTGNTRLDRDLTCTGSATTCTDHGPGYASYWRWQATVDRATGQVLTPPGWTQSPDSYCLGPTDPGASPAASISALVAAQFQHLLVQRAHVTTDPSGRTLVNYETRLSTDATAYDLPALTLLGHTVHVRATPTAYTWTYGDGTTDTDDATTTHLYRTTGTLTPAVTITWSGTYTVDGGPPQQVIGTAQTPSRPTTLVVQQARAQLTSR